MNARKGKGILVWYINSIQNQWSMKPEFQRKKRKKSFFCHKLDKNVHGISTDMSWDFKVLNFTRKFVQIQHLRQFLGTIIVGYNSQVKEMAVFCIEEKNFSFSLCKKFWHCVFYSIQFRCMIIYLVKLRTNLSWSANYWNNYDSGAVKYFYIFEFNPLIVFSNPHQSSFLKQILKLSTD